MSSFFVMSFLLNVRFRYRSPHLLWRRAHYRRTQWSSPSSPEIAALGALSGVAGAQRSTVLLQITGRSLRWPHPSHRLVFMYKSRSQKSHRGGVEPTYVNGRSVPQCPDPYVLKISERPALTGRHLCGGVSMSLWLKRKQLNGDSQDKCRG